MGRFLFIVLAALSFLARANEGGTAAPANVTEATSLAQVENAIGTEAKGTVLAFDLDNTLIESEQMLGSDQWYTYMKKHFLEQGLTEAEALHRTVDLWTKVQLKTKVRAVESDTAIRFQRLTKVPGITVMGLTARPVDLVETTLSQLEGVGILFPRKLAAMDLTARPGNGMREPARFRGGVLFVGENNKGSAFVEFIRSQKITPTRVFFVDDKPYHVTDMRHAVTEAGLPYFGFRYGAADFRVGQFDFRVAEAQRAHFEKKQELITDDAAGKVARLR